ncbi:Radial spoke head protein 9 [Blattella germanica]|nr:Radial spoke head protein 9 [Blattella germanica]
MNINNFHIALNYISYGGYTLSHEQQLVLQNSLIILQNENHFEQTFLWGKIFGLDSDYYIAYGYEKDALKGRVFYYSTNCLDWGLLPEPSKHMKQLALMSSTRLQGDAALKLDVNTEYPVEVATAIEEEDEEDIIEPEENKKSKISQLLKEEDRLAATVALINDEAAIVPRGALFKRPDGYVVQNLAFKGLTLNEAQKLTSYQHYRKPQQRWNTNLLTQQDYNYAIDFLDTIDIDIPEEQTWNIHTKLGGKVVILRNVYWPGMTIYHLVRSEYYGFFYAGIGKKNMDVPFMT